MTASADFISGPGELEKLVGFAADFGRKAGLAGKDLFTLQLVVEELVTNVLEHGGIPAGEEAGRVELSIGDGEMRIRLDDRGKEFNPLLLPEPAPVPPLEERPIGGLGVHFCRKLTDAQDYERRDGRNVLTLRKRLSA
jgi:serine/threonine-protein kinase RsbW